MNPMVEMIFCKNNNHHPKKKTQANKNPQHTYQRNNSSTSSCFYRKKKHLFSMFHHLNKTFFFGQKKSRLSPSSWASPNQTARYHSCYKDRFRWPIVGNQTSKSCHDVEDHPRKWRNTADGRNPAPPGMYKTL